VVETAFSANSFPLLYDTFLASALCRPIPILPRFLACMITHVHALFVLMLVLLVSHLAMNDAKMILFSKVYKPIDRISNSCGFCGLGSTTRHVTVWCSTTIHLHSRAQSATPKLKNHRNADAKDTQILRDDHGQPCKH